MIPPSLTITTQPRSQAILTPPPLAITTATATPIAITTIAVINTAN